MERSLAIRTVLHQTLPEYTKQKQRTGLSFSMNMSYLTNKEFLILKHICSSKLRPKMYLSKKTGEFTPLEGLLIPSDHKYYESIEPDRGNFSKIKKQLIFKRVLYETDYGFVLNHNMIPFTSKATMAHLYKIASIPLPPTDK